MPIDSLNSCQTVLPEETLARLAKLPLAAIEQEIRPHIKFLYRRHQGPSGSLCFLEAEDLHREQAEFYGIRDIIKRTRNWLAGIQTKRIPTDSPEVELFSHFPNQLAKMTFLIPDVFFAETYNKGRFYFSRVTPEAMSEIQRVYLGFALEGATQGSIVIPIKDPDGGYFFGQQIPTKEDIFHRKPEFIKGLEAGTFIEGFWWSADRELEPFAKVEDLAAYLGSGQDGFKALLEGELTQRIARNEDLYIGIRFPSRFPDDRPFEWQFFHLVPTAGDGALIFPEEAELIGRLEKWKVEAIRGEYMDERSFFKRNKGVYAREKLRETGVSLFGVGALGSELADCLAKAGVGFLHLVDMELLKAQNTVRHLCGCRLLYIYKTHAVAMKVWENAHHFVKVSTLLGNVFQIPPENLFARSDAIGVSTIANENTEGYLNEIAVRAKHTVFYARALRGGKAARIFRVTPGQDACKTCLSLYYEDEKSAFIRIEEDPDLPVISTECNNPIRPASAADLKLISSLAAKVVLEQLVKGDRAFNHWIWSTETLPGLSVSPELPYQMTRQFFPPHPDCPVCSLKVPVPIVLSDSAQDQILDEVKKVKVKGIETGGIFIGFESTKKEIVILEASGPGPKAIMTPTRFERDVEYCQKKLEEASVKLGIRGLYVGEWHFHPSGRNEPSPLDIKSLHEIAKQKNYATDHPVMIIADSHRELAGTVHTISTEILPTEIAVIPYKKAMMKEALLRPV